MNKCVALFLQSSAFWCELAPTVGFNGSGMQGRVDFGGSQYST
jgi:hypothetical protein